MALKRDRCSETGPVYLDQGVSEQVCQRSVSSEGVEGKGKKEKTVTALLSPSLKTLPL